MPQPPRRFDIGMLEGGQKRNVMIRFLGCRGVAQDNLKDTFAFGVEADISNPKSRNTNTGAMGVCLRNRCNMSPQFVGAGDALP